MIAVAPNLPVRSSGFALPSTIVVGSFFQLQRIPPTIPDGWSLDTARLHLLDSEGDELVEDGIAGTSVAEENYLAFDILGSHTSDQEEGTYTGYTLFMITHDAGEVAAQDIADYKAKFQLSKTPASVSYDQRILDLLQDTLERKLAGRGDIIQYTIGDRQLATMSLTELNNAISYYRSRVQQYPRIRGVL